MFKCFSFPHPQSLNSQMGWFKNIRRNVAPKYYLKAARYFILRIQTAY